MQKYTIIGGLVLVLGIIVFVTAMSLRGWDIRKLSTRPEYMEKSYTADNYGQNITIKDYNMPYKVGVSKDNRIHLTYYENEKEYYVIENGAELRIERKNEYKWYDYVMNIDFNSPSFTLLLPEGFTGGLEITTSNGRIEAEDISALWLNLTSSNGAVEVSNIKGAEQITVHTSNAPVQARDFSLKNDLSIKTDNGAVTLERISAGNIDADTSNGKINAAKAYTEGDTVLRTSNGAISLDDIGSGALIDLKTSNSSVKGRIAGKASDFTIKSKTSNGKNNLPENMKGGDKTLSAVTSNGSISIEFTD